MRPSFLMLPLVALAACATPREQCINFSVRECQLLNAHNMALTPHGWGNMREREGKTKGNPLQY